MLVIWQKWLYSAKVVVLGQSCCIWVNWLYSGKVVAFGHGDCIRTKTVVFRAKVDLLGQSGYIRVIVVFWLSCSIGENWLYLAKSCCIRAKVVLLWQNGSIGAKWLYSGKLVVCWQGAWNRAKTVVFELKGFIRANWLYLG